MYLLSKREKSMATLFTSLLFATQSILSIHGMPVPPTEDDTTIQHSTAVDKALTAHDCLVHPGRCMFGSLGSKITKAGAAMDNGLDSGLEKIHHLNSKVANQVKSKFHTAGEVTSAFIHGRPADHISKFDEENDEKDQGKSKHDLTSIDLEVTQMTKRTPGDPIIQVIQNAGPSHLQGIPDNIHHLYGTPGEKKTFEAMQDKHGKRLDATGKGGVVAKKSKMGKYFKTTAALAGAATVGAWLYKKFGGQKNVEPQAVMVTADPKGEVESLSSSNVTAAKTPQQQQPTILVSSTAAAAAK